MQRTDFFSPLPLLSLEEAIYLTYQAWAARQPDHVFRNSWHQFCADNVGRTNVWAYPALCVLAHEFLEDQRGRVHVQLDNFGEWQQTVVSRTSGLPIRAAAEVEFFASGRMREFSQKSQPAVLSPFDDLVEDYIEREGLHETHLHLNGSTHAETCWLRALHEPHIETKDFSRSYGKYATTETSKIRELCHFINPELSPRELYRQLKVAKRLREWLIAAADDCIPDSVLWPRNYAELAGDFPPIAPAPKSAHFVLSASSRPGHEITWLCQLLARLKKQPSPGIDRMLHLYLLLHSQYYGLSVQREDQFGFDQFQRFTMTTLRDRAEKAYLFRFETMHGDLAERSRVTYLEGRFAPKANVKDNAQLLQSILGDYLQYVKPTNGTGKPPLYLSGILSQLSKIRPQLQTKFRSRHHLALVVHFIKKPWNWKPGKHTKGNPYRYHALRKDLEIRAGVLLATLETWPDLRTWVRGIDAAANELHAPPEVFASCYRICRHGGVIHRTYHVGEDFPHLLTGLRHMMDALELLDLRSADRIGHGTAMGISPMLWLERTPSKLVLKRSEWILDLLGTWRSLRQQLGMEREAYRVEGDLANMISLVFGRDVSCTAFDRAMRLRGLNMRFLRAAMLAGAPWDWTKASNSAAWREEAKLVHEKLESNRHDVELLYEWQTSNAVWNRSEQLTEVAANYLSCESLLKLQQELMREVAKRRVIIETLPSSNVRISQYVNFREHHSLRWMKVPGFEVSDDPDIMVSLGSDDPGIFAGDLSGEFYHLYSTMRSAGLSDSAALHHLSLINERGRQYRFHARVRDDP